MSKLLRPYVISASLLALTACTNVPAREDTSGFEAARREMAQALSQRDELLELTCDIFEATNRIKRLELKLVETEPSDTEGRSKILKDIADIEAELRTRRERICVLEHKLSGSETCSGRLRDNLAVMSAEIDARMSEVAELKATLDKANSHISSLQGTVETLNRDVRQKDEELSETRGRACRLSSELSRTRDDAATLLDEANGCYYAVADMHSLKSHNVVQGGFLRKTRLMASDFDRDLFRRADKRTLMAIPVAGHRLKVLTTHPAGSYHTESTTEGMVLRITDPVSFWSISNYLVIQTD